MGNQGQSQRSFTVQENWTLLESNKFCRVLQNKLTGALIEQYIVSFTDQVRFQEALLLYQRRLALQSDQHVHLVGFHQLNQLHACATIRSMLIFVQRIPRRLSQLRYSYRKGVHILHEVLVGFQKLCDIQRPSYQVSADMIGISAYDLVKVWFNQNFSSIQPGNELSNAAQTTQHQLVTSLINIVASRLESNQPKFQFLDLLPKPLDFWSVITEVKQWDKLKPVKPALRTNSQTQPNIEPSNKVLNSLPDNSASSLKMVSLRVIRHV